VETIIRDNNFKHKIALSYSRVKTLEHCSQKYYCTYILKMPDAGNSGSSRGNCLHDTLELLAKDRRRKLVKKIIKADTCKDFPGLWKLVNAYAKKWNVADQDNLNMIDQFILVALNTEFYGPPGTIETHIEKAFDFEIEEKDISFRVRGFIDSFHIVKKYNSLYICARDFKSSKAKFSAKDIDANIQGAIYQMAFQYLYPEIPLKDFKFIFVKFPKQPVQEFPLFSEMQLRGLKIYLTYIQGIVNNFNEKDINDNFGALNEKMKFLCGPAKSGWICPHQKPLEYYALKDKDGNIIKTSFNNDIKGGEKMFYPGCSFFYKDGKKRSISFE